MPVTTSLNSVLRMLLAPVEKDMVDFGANHLNDPQKKIVYYFAKYISGGAATALYKYFCMRGMEKKIQELREIGRAVADQMNSYAPGFMEKYVRVFTVDCILNGQPCTLTFLQTEKDVEISLNNDDSFCVVMKNADFSKIQQRLLMQNWDPSTLSETPDPKELIEVEIANNKSCCHDDCSSSETDWEDALLWKLKGLHPDRRRTDSPRSSSNIDKSKNSAQPIGIEMRSDATEKFKAEQHAMLSTVTSSEAADELLGRLHKLKLQKQLSLPDHLYHLGSRRPSGWVNPLHPATPSEPALHVNKPIDT